MAANELVAVVVEFAPEQSESPLGRLVKVTTSPTAAFDATTTPEGPEDPLPSNVFDALAVEQEVPADADRVPLKLPVAKLPAVGRDVFNWYVPDTVPVFAPAIVSCTFEVLPDVNPPSPQGAAQGALTLPLAHVTIDVGLLVWSEGVVQFRYQFPSDEA